TLPLTPTGDAEKPCLTTSPSRSRHFNSPVLAAKQVATLCVSSIRYRYSPYSSGLGMNGEPLSDFQVMCVLVTSPVPSGRIASVGPARPDEQNRCPSPATGVGVTSTRLPPQVQISLPLSGS